jgi:hypothetical protein
LVWEFIKKVKLGLSASTAPVVKRVLEMRNQLLSDIILNKGTLIFIEKPLSLDQQFI